MKVARYLFYVLTVILISFVNLGCEDNGRTSDHNDGYYDDEDYVTIYIKNQSSELIGVNIHDSNYTDLSPGSKTSYSDNLIGREPIEIWVVYYERGYKTGPYRFDRKYTTYDLVISDSGVRAY